jgi:hypothetical protein
MKTNIYADCKPLSPEQHERNRETFYKIHKGKSIDEVITLCFDNDAKTDLIDYTCDYAYGIPLDELIEQFRIRSEMENPKLQIGQK